VLRLCHGIDWLGQDYVDVQRLRGGQVITVTLPIRLVSEANRRDHWAAKAKRVASQRRLVKMALWAKTRMCRVYEKSLAGYAYEITLTRIGPRTLDSDNIQGAFKGVRDQIAECIGVDDGSPRLTWVYGQEKSGPKTYAIRIQITAGGGI